MQLCAPSDLICVLPLKVAINWAGKRRLIWDDSHVKAFSASKIFRMETLQLESRDF